MDVAQVSDVVKISRQGCYQRPIYAGNILVSVESDEPVQVLTVRTTAFDAAVKEARRRLKPQTPSRTLA